MIKIENVEVVGWEAAIRGMRNPLNSHHKIDSKQVPSMLEDEQTYIPAHFEVGPNDKDLMKRLRNAGTDHRKFMRMIVVYTDITAPLYWWKEHDQYKVGTTTNSCSTMHKIHTKEFELSDFSNEHLFGYAEDCLIDTVHVLNDYRYIYVNGGIIGRELYEPKDKRIWWQMIQLLPSSYNQKRTVMLNYEVLANMYKSRKNHKLDEWHKLCDWCETLPYSELITGEFDA